MNTLKINIPDGYEIDTFNTETGEVSFKPIEPEITPEELFLQIFDGGVVRFDREKYPNSVFYFDKKDGKFLAEYVSKSNTFYSNYSKVWHIFQTTFSLNYDSTNELLNKLVEEHFKLKDVTAMAGLPFNIAMVEEHFKLKDVTAFYISSPAYNTVEEHFKVNKVATRHSVGCISSNARPL